MKEEERKLMRDGFLGAMSYATDVLDHRHHSPTSEALRPAPS